MNKEELIKLKYNLESIKAVKKGYKINKYYSIINVNNIIYTGNSIISLFRIERDLDTKIFIDDFQKVQEELIRGSVNNNLLFDEMRIKIYYLLLVDRFELEMIKKDYDIDNRKYDVVPRGIEYLDDVCIVGRVDYELYKDNEIVVSKELYKDYVISYYEFKNNMIRLGYDNFKIDNFDDLESSMYDNRKGIEELSVNFKRYKCKIRSK